MAAESNAIDEVLVFSSRWRLCNHSSCRNANTCTDTPLLWAAEDEMEPRTSSNMRTNCVRRRWWPDHEASSVLPLNKLKNKNTTTLSVPFEGIKEAEKVSHE